MNLKFKVESNTYVSDNALELGRSFPWSCRHPNNHVTETHSKKAKAKKRKQRSYIKKQIKHVVNKDL